MPRNIDVLCVGDLLMSFTTADFAHNPDEASLYKRFPAGEVALLGSELVQQGLTVHAIAAVGQDDLGRYLRKFLEQKGIEVSGVTQLEEPTTLILYNRSADGESVQAYRSADALLAIRQFPYARFEDIHWFHTSAFALSRDPARRVIVEACEKAHRAVCRVSLHINFASCIWPDRAEAQRVLQTYAGNAALVCLSGKDWLALYGEHGEATHVCEYFLKMGAREVLYSPDNLEWWVVSDKEKHHVKLDQAKDTEAVLAAFMAQPIEDRTLEARLEALK